MFPYGQQSAVLLFAVNLKPLNGFHPKPSSVQPNDEVCMITLFNVTRSLQINFIVQLCGTAWRLGEMAGFEWQHTCDLVFKNECLPSSRPIHQLIDYASHYQTPILVYEAHPLAQGDRLFKNPITTRHFPILHERRRCDHRTVSPPRTASPPPPQDFNGCLATREECLRLRIRLLLMSHPRHLDRPPLRVLLDALFKNPHRHR